jgi:UDP-2,3-diacylglucosamine pyrophosphatase LpxH
MLEAKELIVLSDIHLGPEFGKGLFRADKELVNCLNWILENKDNCYVVLAGDIFDFLVLGEDEEVSDFHNLDKVEIRIENIVKIHPKVFDAFAKLANSPNHQLLFIAGNHDPEVVFPEVQSCIERRLSDTNRPITKWTVHGESLRIKVGLANVLIEHGNLFDKFNRVDHKGLREVLSLKNRGFSVNEKGYYDPPFGSKLVLEHINPIRKDFPWLDYLKPLKEAVYPMIRELTTIKQKISFLRAIKDFLWLVSEDELSKFRSNWNREEAYRSSKDDKFSEWLNKELDKQYQSECRGVFLKSDDSELITELISNWKDISDISLHDSAYEAVSFILNQNPNLVITGHTHQAKIYPIDKGLYINTGTWGQLLQTPQKDDSKEVWGNFIENLKAGPKWIDNSFSRLTFANIKFDSNTDTTTASLIEWKKTMPDILATWSWNSTLNNWEASL